MNDQQPDLRDINDGYYTKLYEEEINVEKGEEYKHIITDIVSDAGLQNASSISIDFDPSFELLTIHHITVWRNGKPIDRLKKDAFKVIANEQDLSRHIYNGTYSAYLILEDIRVGDKIEYSYTIKGTNPIFEGKFFTNFSFQGSDPISQVHYFITVSDSRTLNFKYFNNADKPTITKNNASVQYEWNLLNVKGHESDSKSPGWFNPIPHVQISEYKSWREVTDWAYQINTPNNKLSGAIAKLIGDLKNKNKEDIPGLIRELTNIVQNEIRYMGVEMGINSHKANNPEKVFSQRYGDCKDKSLLLVSMLRSAGLQADMALVNSVLKEKVTEHIPAPSAFNHAIVVVHLSNKDVWIDPTIAGQGGSGVDFYCPEYGKALVLRPGADSLATIPETQIGQIKYDEYYNIVDIHSPISLTVETTYSLSAADNFRNSISDQSRHDLEKNYLNYYTKIYPHIKSVDSVIIIDNKNNNIVKTLEKYEIDDFLEYDSVNQYYSRSLYCEAIRSILPNVENKYKYPVSVEYPYDINCSVRVNAPFIWQIADKKDTLHRNAYYFSKQVFADSNQLSINYKLAYLKDNINIDEIAQYEKDRKKLVDDYLSFTFSYTPANANKHKNLNLVAIALFAVVLCGCSYGCIRIYKIKTLKASSIYEAPKPFVGWLIIPVIGLLYTGGRSIYTLFSDEMFYQGIWHVYDYKTFANQFKAILWGEFIVKGIYSCFAAFCLILMIFKRDILPRCMIAFYICMIVFVTIDSFISHIFLQIPLDTKNILRSFFAACIWIPYFSRSKRVKEIFVVPYPHPDAK